LTDAGAVSRPAVSHRDERGTITDLVTGERFDAITVITSRKGAVRGNHYHQETLQVLYVIRGRIELVTQTPGGPVRSQHAGPGDLVRTPPVERHAIVALEDSEFIVFTRGPRAGREFETDTFRLEEPLVRAR
jgi:oxalate decarboxylase/phosphoglucose isomerase-like protein (cupin superfamily)